MVIGREWCRRPIDSRIYTAENWRPLIEHTICRSWPQVIRHPPPPPHPRYRVFRIRTTRAASRCSLLFFTRSAAPRRTGFELGINTLFALSAAISVHVAHANRILSITDKKRGSHNRKISSEGEGKKYSSLFKKYKKMI